MTKTREQGYQEIIERLKNKYELYPNEPHRWIRKDIIDLAIPILENAIKNNYSIDKTLEELDKLDCFRDARYGVMPKGLNSVKSMLHTFRMWVD